MPGNRENRPKVLDTAQIPSDVGKGWYPIIEDLSKQLDEICPGWTLAQAKEKFGILRFYVDVPDDYSWHPSYWDDPLTIAILDAEYRSSQTCEECGKDGKKRGIGESYFWAKTLCEECYGNR